MNVDENLTEEAWEADVASLLGGLPFVDPPPGLIDDVLTHRPLHSGRVVLGLGLAAVFAIGAWLGTGNIGGDFVVPPVADLVAQHDVTADEASDVEVLNSNLGFTVGSGDSAVEIEQVPGSSDAASLPDGFERRATFAGSELEQQIYASSSSAVSIFIQPGAVDFDDLPAEGRTTIEGVAAWSDPVTMTVVVQTTDSAVTIVGLSESEVSTVVASIEAPGTFADRLGRRVGEWTAQLGFADPS